MSADEPALTTLHARRARDGDAQSLGWLAERFQPLLLAQARYRLGPPGLAGCEPEDLVGETWAVALPRLAGLDERDGRVTPVVLRFLSTTLLQLANNHVRRGARRAARAPADAEGARLAELSAEQRRALSEVGARESAAAVRAALDALEDKDREVLLLRGIEQLANADAAALLGETPDAVSSRYRRALERLRTALPRSIFADLEPD